MSSKQKVIVSSIVAVLVLAVIGLTIGLVLVAQSAGLGSSMRVTYTAGSQVDCSIVATAKNYSTAEDVTGTPINIKEGESYSLTSKTIDIDAALSDADATADKIGTIEFQQVSITAQGRAIYKFEFTNTAGAGAGDIQVQLNAALETDPTKYGKEAGTQYDPNTVLGVGATEAEALAEGAPSTLTIADISVGDAAVTIYVALTVDDASVDADGIANITIAITPDTAA